MTKSAPHKAGKLTFDERAVLQRVVRSLWPYPAAHVPREQRERESYVQRVVPLN
jgi:hypothetical protein